LRYLIRLNTGKIRLKIAVGHQTQRSNLDPIPYSRQKITAEDMQAVLAVLDQPLITQGPLVEQFEAAIAQLVGADHAVAVANGTAALHLAARALGVGPGTKVLVSPNTFVASANCIRYCGGDVEFVDTDPHNFCIDLDALEEKLKSHPRGTYSGLVCVDFAGYPMDMERVRKLADRYGLWIIDDACHAIGARFQNSSGNWISVGSGQYADLTCFSFHPVKHIATGEGGMITTRNKELDAKLRFYRSHGITRDPNLLKRRNEGPWYYEMQELGFNYRLTDILCALGLSQLKRISDNISRRHEIAKIYRQELQGLPILLPQEVPGVHHAYHLFVALTENRDGLYDYLWKRSIRCQIHYIPVYKQPYYENLYGPQILPNCEAYYKRAISIPMFAGLSDGQLGYVIENIKRFYLGFEKPIPAEC